MLWIEERTGRPIDPTRMDIVQAWDSVGRILGYIEGETGSDTPATAAPRPTVASHRGMRIVPYEAGHREAVARLQTGLWSPDVDLNLRGGSIRSRHAAHVPRVRR